MIYELARQKRANKVVFVSFTTFITVVQMMSLTFRIKAFSRIYNGEDT